MRLADDLGLVPSLHESVHTTYGRRRVFLVMCSMWQKVVVATYATAFSNEDGDACDVFWEYRLRVGRLCACWNTSGTFLGMSFAV